MVFAWCWTSANSDFNTKGITTSKNGSFSLYPSWTVDGITELIQLNITFIIRWQEVDKMSTIHLTVLTVDCDMNSWKNCQC